MPRSSSVLVISFFPSLSYFERLHDFTRLLILYFLFFPLRSSNKKLRWRRSRLVSQRVSGRFVCFRFILSPVPLTPELQKRRFPQSAATETTRTRGTVCGRREDTWRRSGGRETLGSDFALYTVLPTLPFTVLTLRYRGRL